MTSAGISAGVEQFIQAHIDSVELLEVLLHLQKNSLRDLPATAIATSLYSNPGSITLRLRRLHGAGLVDVVEDVDPLYHYKPNTPEKDAVVRELAKLYQERSVAIISMILSRQASNVQAFSNAFVLGKRRNF